MKSQVDERQIRIRIQKAMQQICPNFTFREKNVENNGSNPGSI
jgi:hypothetical protein